MKKISLFLLFIVLLSSCSPQVSPENEDIPTLATNTSTPAATLTPRPTFTATATLIPCPNEPFSIEEITITFHDKDIKSKDCNDILNYVRLTNEKFKSLGYKTGSMQIHISTNPNTLTDILYDTAKEVGCNPDTKDNILRVWEHGGAQSTKGAAFYRTIGWWQEIEQVEKSRAIVGEMSHMLIKNILGSCQKTWTVPDWYTVGWTEFNSDEYSAEWGLPPQPDDLFTCKDNLSYLTRDHGYCVYMQAQMAFNLLRDSPSYGNGIDKSMDVFIEIAKGKNFNQAFLDVYNISVSTFSDEFDAYRLNGYKLIESTPTP